MIRFPDWPERLAAFLEARKDLPFSWGQQDCALLACDAVREITGVDPAAEFRGRYDSAESAAGALAEFLTQGAAPAEDEEVLTGLEEVAEKIAADLELKEIHPALAQRGDVVLLHLPRGTPALGIVSLNGEIAVQAADRIRTLPLAAAARAWRI